jgi:hypothetical protein
MPSVLGEGLAELRRQVLGLALEPLDHVIGRARGQLDQHDVAGAPFDQGGDARALPRSDQQVPLPVPRDRPVLDGRRRLADRDGARNRAPSFRGGAPALALPAPCAEGGGRRVAFERPTDLHERRLVDGLERSLKSEPGGDGARQPARNLLRGPARFEPLGNKPAQAGLLPQLAGLGARGALSGGLLGAHRLMGHRPAIAPDLPAYHRPGTPQRPGYRPHSQSLRQPSGDLLLLGGAHRPRGPLAGALREPPAFRIRSYTVQGARPGTVALSLSRSPGFHRADSSTRSAADSCGRRLRYVM